MLQTRNSSGTERVIRRISGNNIPPDNLEDLLDYEEDESNLVNDDVFEEDIFQPVAELTEKSTPVHPPVPVTSEKGAWEWFNDSLWNPYDQETNAIIEEGYSNKLPTVPLNHGFFGDSGGYTIDFTNMNQIRDTTGYTRQIRRTPPAIPIPGAVLARPPKISQRQKLPPRNAETIHCDPAIMNELQTAIHLLSNKPNDVVEEGVPVQEIFVED
jgi:hypothetical protein